MQAMAAAQAAAAMQSMGPYQNPQMQSMSPYAMGNGQMHPAQMQSVPPYGGSGMPPYAFSGGMQNSIEMNPQQYAAMVAARHGQGMPPEAGMQSSIEFNPQQYAAM